MAQLNQVGRVATSQYYSNGFNVVRYHSTEVVKFNSDKIILNSNGWQTQTTKTRMNQTSNQHGLGFQVYQKDWEWFVDFQGDTLEFTDGMELER